MLTLWNLGDDELETLSEGAHVRVERVLAKAHRGGTPTSQHAQLDV